MKNYSANSPKNNYPLLIPGIVEKIEKVLSRLKLVPEETVKDFIFRAKGKKHRYSAVCRGEKGNKIIFYADLHKKAVEKERMKTEIKIAKVFMKKKLSPFFPEYLGAGIEKDFTWLVRKLFPETPIEKKNDIEKLKRKLGKKEIKKIVEALFSANNLPAKKFPFLKKFSVEKYLELVEGAKNLENEGVLSKKDAEKAEKLILENKKILEKENNYFAHGDFQIGNIVISDNILKIIDFESSHLNNFAYDVALLTSRLWREPKTRKEILKEYLKNLPKQKKETFRVLFRINCFFNGYHTFRSQPREYSKEMLEKRRKFCSRLLKAALGGFEELANL